MRIREIIVLGSFAPITIFSTKFTDSLTGNAKLAGFSLTVTAIISLVVMTALHALLPVFGGKFNINFTFCRHFIIIRIRKSSSLVVDGKINSVIFP